MKHYPDWKIQAMAEHCNDCAEANTCPMYNSQKLSAMEVCYDHEEEPEHEYEQ